MGLKSCMRLKCYMNMKLWSLGAKSHGLENQHGTKMLHESHGLENCMGLTSRWVHDIHAWEVKNFTPEKMHWEDFYLHRNLQTIASRQREKTRLHWVVTTVRNKLTSLFALLLNGVAAAHWRHSRPMTRMTSSTNRLPVKSLHRNSISLAVIYWHVISRKSLLGIAPTEKFRHHQSNPIYGI